MFNSIRITKGGLLLENFFELRAEKQQHIIDAALTVFGKSGYKKASLADIAQQAGISKGMVLYYFGSKKNLYLYLAQMGAKMMVDEMEAQFDPSVVDFFGRIKMTTDIKIAMMRKHPAIMSFLTGLYYETDPEVKTEIDEFIAASIKTRERWMGIRDENSHFKEGIDPAMLARFLVWAGEGFASSLPIGKNDIGDIEGFIAEFYAILDIMKKHFYKE